MRLRKIKKYAGMDVIKLNPTDRKDKGWNYEDEVDIDKIPDNLLVDESELTQEEKEGEIDLGDTFAKDKKQE